jgi:cytochrome c oxidase subunit 3
MIALPSAPAPAPRRQLFVGTALASAAAASLVGGMLALYLRFRDVAIHGADGRWVPKGVKISLVPPNVMLLALIPLCVFAQWAVYAAKRGDRSHVGVALFLVVLMGLAFINGQAVMYGMLELPINQGSFSVMFYAITGVVLALVVAGVVFTLITVFRYLGGRSADRELVSAHALYWYCFSAIFALVWFVVYVTK